MIIFFPILGPEGIYKFTIIRYLFLNERSHIENSQYTVYDCAGAATVG